MPKRTRNGYGQAGVAEQATRDKTRTIGGLLFRLPPELRNIVYKRVLPHDQRYPVTKTLRTPPLLRLCRGIRQETLKMWYGANRFHHDIEHCDARVCVAWDRRCQAQELECGDQTFSVTGRLDWDALMQWCRAICEEGCPCARNYGGNTRLQAGVAAATNIALQFFHIGQPWAACAPVLGELRQALGRFDGRWTQTKVDDREAQRTSDGVLFTLPPELRNAVYEYALTSPDMDIKVTKDLRIPPLIQTSRQIRSETRGIWHGGNTFTHDIQRCNADLFLAWLRHLHAQGLKAESQVADPRGTLDWAALMRWCRATCEEGFPGLQPEQG
ncbi:hypothetical protein LTR53_012683, partial [Teratosphaeriaceae sp. CCFEE 6253]